MDAQRSSCAFQLRTLIHRFAIALRRRSNARQMSPANNGLNLFHHSLTVSWQISIPRSNSRSSTFRNDSGKRMYVSISSRITSGKE